MSARARRGALPGPAAYQRGGTEPTVTDADILLGYMGVESFVGGSFKVSTGGGPRRRWRSSRPRWRQRRPLRLGHPRPRQRIHEQGGGHARDRPAASIPARCRWSPSAAPVRCMPTASRASSASSASSARPGRASPRRSACSSRRSRSTSRPASRWASTTGILSQMQRLLDDLAAQGTEVVQRRRRRRRRRSPTATPSTCAMSGRATRSRSRCPTAACRRTNSSQQLLEQLLPGSTASSSAAPSSASDVEVITWRLRASGGKDQVTRPHRAARRRRRSRASDRSTSTNSAPTSRRPSTTITSCRSISRSKGPAIVEQRESTVVVGPSGIAHVDAHGNLVINIL